MYLGQVNVAEDAVNFFQKGIELMIKKLNTLPANSEKVIKWINWIIYIIFKISNLICVNITLIYKN